MFVSLNNRTDVAAFAERARQIGADVEAHLPPERPNDFGRRLRSAVERRLNRASSAADSAAEAEAREDFGHRLKEAVKRIAASRSPSRSSKTEALSDDETLAQKVARAAKARAKGVRICPSMSAIRAEASENFGQKVKQAARNQLAACRSQAPPPLSDEERARRLVLAGYAAAEARKKREEEEELRDGKP